MCDRQVYVCTLKYKPTIIMVALITILTVIGCTENVHTHFKLNIYTGVYTVYIGIYL